MKIQKNSKYHPLRFEAMNSTLVKEIKRHKNLTDDTVFNFELNEDNLDVAISFAQFYNYGRVIYDLDSELQEALKNTEILDIQCRYLNFPHRSFYLHIGSLWLDGMYCLTGQEGVMLQLILKEDDNYSAPIFIGLKQDKDLGICLSEAFSKVRTNDTYLNNILNHKDYLDYESISSFCAVIFFNFILYLTAKREDILAEWTPAVSKERLVIFAKRNTPTDKAVQEKTLNAEGYRKIYHIGQQYKKNITGTADTDTGRKIAPHIRRGHFRLQAHGKNLEFRKVIFVAPTFVNASSVDEITTGRIYTVS